MSRIGNIRAFDQNAQGYDKNSDSQHNEGKKTISYAIQKTAEIVEQNGLNTLRVLDAGCGNGRTTINLYKNLKQELQKINKDICISVTAIDISPNMLKIAQERVEKENLTEKITFYCKNLEELTDEVGTFDLIFSNIVLHWCTPQIHNRFIERLMPGGVLVANQAGKNHYKSFLDMAYEVANQEPFAKYFVGWTIPAFYPAKNELKEILSGAGFSNIEIIEDEYKDYNYEKMIETFINASLLLFKERLPSNELKAMFEEKYRALAKEQPDKFKHVYRLYMLAKKGHE